MRRLRVVGAHVLALAALCCAGCAGTTGAGAYSSGSAAGAVSRQLVLSVDGASVAPDPRSFAGITTVTPFEPPADVPYGFVDGDRSVFAGGATVSLVKGMTPAQVLDVLDDDSVIDPGSAAEIWPQFVELPRDDRTAYPAFIVARQVGDWTLVVEENGFRAAFLADALSSSGEAVVVYRSVDADASFTYAKAGTTVRFFDPLLFDMIGSQTGEPLPEEAGIAFGEEPFYPQSRCFVLVERLTGVSLTEADLAIPGDGLAVVVRY